MPLAACCAYTEIKIKMSNKNLAIILQNDYENEFDSIMSDVELVTRATELASEEFSVSGDDASFIGREVLKLYSEVVA